MKLALDSSNPDNHSSCLSQSKFGGYSQQDNQKSDYHDYDVIVLLLFGIKIMLWVRTLVKSE